MKCMECSAKFLVCGGCFAQLHIPYLQEGWRDVRDQRVQRCSASSVLQGSHASTLKPQIFLLHIWRERRGRAHRKASVRKQHTREASFVTMLLKKSGLGRLLLWTLKAPIWSALGGWERGLWCVSLCHFLGGCEHISTFKHIPRAISFNDGIKCSHCALLYKHVTCGWARLPYPHFADVDQESWETNNFPKYNQLLHEARSGSRYSFYSQLLAWFLAVDLQDISKQEFQLVQSMYKCLQG